MIPGVAKIGDVLIGNYYDFCITKTVPNPINHPLCTVILDNGHTLEFKADSYADPTAIVAVLTSTDGEAIVLGSSDRSTFLFYNILPRHIYRLIVTQICNFGGTNEREEIEIRKIFNYYFLRKGPTILHEVVQINYEPDHEAIAESEKLYNDGLANRIRS